MFQFSCLDRLPKSSQAKIKSVCTTNCFLQSNVRVQNVPKMKLCHYHHDLKRKGEIIEKFLLFNNGFDFLVIKFDHSGLQRVQALP